MEVKKIPKRVVTLIEPKQNLVVDKEKYQQKRVAAYCRVSTDSDEQLTSYETQKKVYSEMIAANKEWCLAGIYADEGISGTRADKRPQFQKMIKDCLAGKIDYIITKSVSRFARNTVECLEYVRMLKARNIGIFFEEQNIDTIKNDSELYLVIYAGFAQSESESMSKNITWAVRKNFEDGKVTLNYTSMLGYRKGADGQPEIVEEEADIIRRIFDQYLAGWTCKQICDALNNEGIFTKLKKPWCDSTIHRVLRNEKYCGDAILQKSVTIDCISKTRRKNCGEAPMYAVQNSHPAIVSRDTFNKVQAEIAKRNAKAPASVKMSITAQGKYSKYALTDIVHCAECGSKYRRATWNIRGNKKIVWRCVSRLDYGTKYCKSSPTLLEDDLKKAIARAIKKYHNDDANTFMTLMKATIGDAIGLTGNTEEADLLQRRMDGLNRKMMEMVNQSIANGSGIDEKEEEFKQLALEIEGLKKRILAIEEASKSDEDTETKIRYIQETIEKRKDHLGEYDDSIVRQMIECIRVYDDKRIEVIFGGGFTVEETVVS